MNTPKRSDSISAYPNIPNEITTVSPNVQVQSNSTHSEYQSTQGIDNVRFVSSPSPLPPHTNASSIQTNSNNTDTPSASTSSSNLNQSSDNKDGLRIAVQSEGPYSLPNFGAYKHNRMR